jgi:indolepyruvate ferredoxin oxidoreductase
MTIRWETTLVGEAVGARPQTAFTSGLQSLLLLIFDQRRRDVADGLRTKALVTGYPGSPLAGVDLQLERHAALLEQAGVVHRPAAAEERAATALMGSQMLDGFPHSGCDGVVGYWYGKGPGVDRSGDALRHGNFAGTSKFGAVVVLSGEDHEAKSSTMPFQEEYAFASAGIPVLYPSSVGEFHTLGIHAVAMSRFTGCWVALKLVTQLCDGGETLDIEPVGGMPAPPADVDGRPFEKRADFTFFPGRNVDVERHLYDERHAAVRSYARHHRLDRYLGAADGDRLAIVSAGKSYADVRQALADVGISGDAALARSPIRLAKLSMIYPLDAAGIARFVDGVDRVVVVEEKRTFLEQQMRAGLQQARVTVTVIGKRDRDGSPLLPVEGGFDADTILEKLAPTLRDCGVFSSSPRSTEISSVRSRAYSVQMPRSPNYCSGCPHSLSTRLPDGAIAWGSPGCHSFATVIEQPNRHITAMTQLGGEGLPWIGLAPFVEKPHIIQNVGDGSLWHSSYDNIRACVAAGVNITFKILYNGVVANTGAQPAPGARSVAALTRLLELEGVKRVALVTKERGRYPRSELSKVTELHPPEDIEKIQSAFAGMGGVTVVIYDESCANERRRLRKRGVVPAAREYVFINDRVCENCGDCGKVSNCMSLQKRPTPFGDKTFVHPSSCNQDYSCLEGDCPSFVTVRVKKGGTYRTRQPVALGGDDLPAPERSSPVRWPCRIYSPGVGGTGVLTMNAILAVAATLDGLRVLSYDQTGAAQKWGTVLSSVVVAPPDVPIWSNKVGAASADLCLGLDLVAAASPSNLDRYSPERTVAIVNRDVLPMGEMVRDRTVTFDAGAAEELLRCYTRAATLCSIPARTIAEHLFGDYMLSNMVVVGAAYQSGALPISAESIERAIELNGVSVERNRQAFRHGRKWVMDSEASRSGQGSDVGGERITPYPPATLRRRDRRVYERLASDAAVLEEDLLPAVLLRLADLADYQDASYAGRYLEFVLRAAALERAIRPGGGGLVAERVAIGLHKLMAYKDEYEVARLYLQPGWREEIGRTFDGAERISFNLHPPVLRAIGFDRKLRFGPWFTVAFRVLRAMTPLRGTALDPFGYARVRREERALVEWYRSAVQECLESGTDKGLELAKEIAALPEEIRGYEDLKLASAAAARERGDALLDQLRRPRIAVHSS